MDWSWMVPVGVVGSIAIGSVMNTWIRAKHGYPVENENGKLVDKTGELPTARQVELLTGENERLRGQVARLEDRLATVERIVTDPATRIAHEIEALRG